MKKNEQENMSYMKKWEERWLRDRDELLNTYIASSNDIGNRVEKGIGDWW